MVDIANSSSWYPPAGDTFRFKGNVKGGFGIFQNMEGFRIWFMGVETNM